MLLNVKNRSPESWGPLAKCSDSEFNRILNNRKGSTKDLIKKVKKLKTYRVSFIKEWRSDSFELQAESDREVGAAAARYFRENEDKIGFKEAPRSKWTGEYKGYDSISCVKVGS